MPRCVDELVAESETKDVPCKFSVTDVNLDVRLAQKLKIRSVLNWPLLRCMNRTNGIIGK